MLKARAGLFATLAFTAGVFTPPAYAEYPQRPIKMIVGFVPGATADGVARILSTAMAKRLGQSIIVENKAAANGVVATNFVAGAPPDGYTIFFTSMGLVINPHLYRSAQYDPVNSFTPIGQVFNASNVLVIPGKSPYGNLQDLIAYAKKNPGTLNVGSAGIGSTSHLAAELFMELTGTRMVHVPYKGMGAAVPELLSGSLTVLFPNMSSAMPLIENGSVKALGVTSATRTAAAPRIPTLAEAGVTGYEMSVWYGMIGPANMPTEVTRRLNQELNIALADPEVKQRLNALGLDLTPGTPDAFAQFIGAEAKKWRDIVRRLNIEKN